MNKYYMEFVNEMSLEEMAHLGKPKLKEIYDNALVLSIIGGQDKKDSYTNKSFEKVGVRHG